MYENVIDKYSVIYLYVALYIMSICGDCSSTDSTLVKESLIYEIVMIFYKLSSTYVAYAIIYVHSPVGMGGCSIRDYLERMKQLVQFYGQVDNLYNQKTIHALKSKLSVELSTFNH